MESLWLIIVLFFIFLLIFPMLFKFNIVYEPFENSGVVVLSFFFFDVYNFTFEIKSNSIVIRTKKTRKQIEYNFSDPALKFYEQFSLELKEKIRIKRFDINSVIGTKDAAQTGLIAGIMSIIYHALASYIYNIKVSTKVTIDEEIVYNQEVFKLRLFGKISISLFDILFCFITSLFITKYGQTRT